MSNVTELTKAVFRLHNCEAKHIGSEPIKEVFKGKTVWDGVVEIFTITGHPKAKKCYAWSYKDDDGKTRYITVLELPPVNSALTAVRASIMADNQGK